MRKTQNTIRRRRKHMNKIQDVDIKAAMFKKHGLVLDNRLYMSYERFHAIYLDAQYQVSNGLSSFSHFNHRQEYSIKITAVEGRGPDIFRNLYLITINDKFRLTWGKLKEIKMIVSDRAEQEEKTQMKDYIYNMEYTGQW